MEYLGLLLALGLSFLLGVLVVNFLTSHPLRMNWYLLAASVVFFLLLVIHVASFRGLLLLIAVSLSLVAFLVGYIVMTRSFLGREDPRPIPKLRREKGDPGLVRPSTIPRNGRMRQPIPWMPPR